MSQSSQSHTELDYWQLASKLEAGRAEVLRRVAKGDCIDSILQLLCKNSEVYNPHMKSSVLMLNADAGTLHPIASFSLPQDYCNALDGVHIGLGVGSCGTAAFSKQRVIVDDINTHPYWDQYKDLALNFGLQACWSEPIIGAEGNVFGTFAMYYSKPTCPSNEDLKFIETCANLAAIVFESHQTRQQLLDANQQLNQTVDEQNQQLKRANLELSTYIKQQAIDNQHHLHSEKAITTQMLLMGFAHEINTPLGIALTGVSHSQSLIESFKKEMKAERLTKHTALQTLDALHDASGLSLKSLERTADLIAKFKEMDSRVFQEDERTYFVLNLLEDMKQHLRIIYPEHTYQFEAAPEIECHSKLALRTLFNHLIENSILHGFGQQQGRISIFVSQDEQGIQITYQDDGQGIKDGEGTKVFEPFYSTTRTRGQLGLGLSVINNILVDIYQGSIKLIDSPVGVRYLIFLPEKHNISGLRLV